MRPSALVSKLLLHAEKLNRDTNTEVADSLTAPPELSNEKADDWHAREKAVAAYLIASTLQDYFSDVKAAAKKQMELHGVMKKLEKVDIGSKDMLFSGVIGDVIGKCAKPAQSIKAESVAGRLRAVYALDEPAVEKFLSAVTDSKQPARSIEVVPHAEI